MSTAQRLFRNTSILIIANSIQPVISFFLIVTISRQIGVDGLGAYSTIFYNYVPVFQITASFGLRNLLTREIAQNKEDTARYLVSSGIIAIIFSLASAVVMTLLVSILSDDPIIIRGTAYASIALVAVGLGDIFEGVISGYEKLSQIGLTSFAENVARVAVSLLLIYNGFQIIALVWVYVVLRFFRIGYYFFYVSRYIAKPKFEVDWRLIADLTRQARTFALIMICVTVYWKADGIMLESMRSTEEVGFYSAAYRFLMLALVLVDSFVNSLFPIISGYFKSSGTQFEVACKKSLRILVLSTVPIAVALSILAKDILVLFYGEKYLASVPVLQILIWTLVPYAISQIFAYALVASNNQRLDLIVNASSMMSNIALNLFMIPRYGFIGATIATLISIHIYVALQIPFVFQRLIRFESRVILLDLSKVIVAAALMAGFLFLLRNVYVLVVLPLSFIVYIGFVFALHIIPGSDRALMLRLLKRT